jgi:hypothetical protein
MVRAADGFEEKGMSQKEPVNAAHLCEQGSEEVKVHLQPRRLPIEIHAWASFI